MLRCIRGISGCYRRLSRSCRTRYQGAAAPFQATVDKPVKAIDTTLIFFSFKILLMHRRD